MATQPNRKIEPEKYPRKSLSELLSLGAYERNFKDVNQRFQVDVINGRPLIAVMKRQGKSHGETLRGYDVNQTVIMTKVRGLAPATPLRKPIKNKNADFFTIELDDDHSFVLFFEDGSIEKPSDSQKTRDLIKKLMLKIGKLT